MKFYLLFFVLNLAIILAYTDFDDKGKLRIEKMKNHSRKVENLLRNLEDTSDESDDDGSVDSNDDGNSNEEEPNKDEPLPTTPKKTGKKGASVQIVDFANFKAEEKKTVITFNTFIIYRNVKPARTVIIMIAVRTLNKLRYLEDFETKPANCTIDPEDEKKTEGNIKYNCDAEKKPNAQVTNVTLLNITFDDPNIKSEDINYSEGAALAATQLSKQTDTINKMFQLNDGQITTYPSYFIITGKIDDDDFKNKYGINDTLKLKVVDNSKTPSTTYYVACKGQDKGNKNYEFRCTPEEGVKGSIYLSTIKDANDNAISLDITKGKDSIDYSQNGTDLIPNINKGIATYRKSSNGLSGGAIAGIVIACAVVLIIATLVAIMMKKSSVALAPFQTQTPSIVGLRSVDNTST
jgi:hypothetical protein